MLEASESESNVPRAATSSALIVFASTVSASLLQGAVSGMELGPLPGFVIAGGLGLGLFVYQRAVDRDARTKRAFALHQAAENHELSFNPLSVAFIGLLGLLFVEFVVGLVAGFGLTVAGVTSDQALIVGTGLISLPFVLLAAGLVGRYLSLRISKSELLWIAGTVLAVRLVSLLIGLALSLGRLGFSPFNEAIAAVLGFGAAWIGHAIAKRQEYSFTISYLAHLLDHDDRLALIELTAKAVEPASPHANQLVTTPPTSVDRSRWCTSCGAELNTSDRFCVNCGAGRTDDHQLG